MIWLVSQLLTQSYDGRITKVSRSSPQNKSEIITNQHDKIIPTKRYISPEVRLKVIDDLRLT